MQNVERNPHAYDETPAKITKPRIIGAGTFLGDDVYNQKNENLGEIKEVMLDVDTGRVAYAVLSFGGFLGLGEKLFAVPWESLTIDDANRRFILQVDKELLSDAPGFDHDNWPDMADPAWAKQIQSYYDVLNKRATL